MTALVVTDPEALGALVTRCRGADKVALDIESNGLHAYRARLCTMQLSWFAEGEVPSRSLAVIDTIACAEALPALAPLLGADGPVKVIHDLSFDARILHQSGLALARVRDTAIAARFLGEQATGLAALTRKHCGVELSKELQEHDWAARPLTSEQVAYLVADVQHLLELDSHLERHAVALGIDAEIALECAHQLASALAPATARLPHVRIDGYSKLPALQRTVVRHLCEQRELIAEREDVPPFRIAPSKLLVNLAQRRPGSTEQVRRLCGRHRAGQFASDWLAALGRGSDDGPDPEPSRSPGPGREEQTARRTLERALASWRRAQAAARGVDPQVVAPGHCMTALAAALSLKGRDEREHAVATIAGFGDARLARHGAELLELAEAPADGAPRPSPNGPADRGVVGS